MSLVVVGSVALDSVETPFGKKDDVLGGSATFFSTAASFFTKTDVVAVVGEDFPEEHLEFLRSRGVGLDGLTREKGKTFRWKGRYTHELNEAHTLDTQLNVFQNFAPNLPANYRKAEYLFLGNIHPALQLQVLEQIEKPKFIAMDTMNFWINGELAALKKTLAKVDLLFVNDAEARLLSGESNVVQAAKAIRAMGPSKVAIKRGEYGSLLFDGDSIFACPAFPLTSVFDPTGAGDTFAGGFMGYLARDGQLTHATLRQATAVGSLMASFTVEKFSLERLREVTTADISARHAALRTLTHFDELPSIQAGR